MIRLCLPSCSANRPPPERYNCEGSSEDSFGAGDNSKLGMESANVTPGMRRAAERKGQVTSAVVSLVVLWAERGSETSSIWVRSKNLTPWAALARGGEEPGRRREDDRVKADFSLAWEAGWAGMEEMDARRTDLGGNSRSAGRGDVPRPCTMPAVIVLAFEVRAER